MVEGYETQEQRERRLAREEAQSEAARRSSHAALEAQLPRAIGEALQRLRGTPNDCVIEVHGTTFGRGRDVVRRRVPGWFIGTVRGYALSSWVSFAVDGSGKLYVNRDGVGERKEFSTDGPPKKMDWWLGALLDLVDRTGR